MKTATSLDSTSLERAEGRGVSQISSGQVLYTQRTVSSVLHVCTHSVTIAGRQTLVRIVIATWGMDYTYNDRRNARRSKRCPVQMVEVLHHYKQKPVPLTNGCLNENALANALYISATMDTFGLIEWLSNIKQLRQVCYARYVLTVRRRF
jgi:hypothetical protein